MKTFSGYNFIRLKKGHCCRGKRFCNKQLRASASLINTLEKRKGACTSFKVYFEKAMVTTPSPVGPENPNRLLEFMKMNSSLIILHRTYFPRLRKYQRLFSEPTYWHRRSWGQYGEGNNQAGIFEAEGNKSLIPGRLARSPLTCPSTGKVRDESVVSLCSERCNASTGSPWLSGPKWFDRLFPPAIVNCNRCRLKTGMDGLLNDEV